MGPAFAASAGILVLLGYGMYLRDQVAERVKPNATSWALWTVGEAVSVLVYRDVTHDWTKLVVPLTCLFGSAAILFMAVRTRRFVLPDRTELTAAGLDLLMFVGWMSGKVPGLTYAVLLLSTCITFVPIIRSTLLDPDNERPLTWAVWVAGYACFLMTTLLNWESLAATALPALYCILHGLVGGLAVRKYGLRARPK